MNAALLAALSCLAALTSTAALGAQTVPRQPLLSSSLGGQTDSVSTDGTVDLSWRVDGADEEPMSFELEETGQNGDRVLIDAGSHLAAALSGRDDGVYRYRVRAVTKRGTTGPWSPPIDVRFEHHSLALALSLFALGATVFVATAGLVLLGHRRSRLAHR